MRGPCLAFKSFCRLATDLSSLLCLPLELEGSSFGPTFSRILGDLVHLRVSSFAGGGLLGAILYTPIAFLLSNIGTYFIGGLLIVLGLLL